MKLLVDINKQGKVSTENNKWMLVPEFKALENTKGLGDKIMCYIVLMHDYQSPYRFKPEKQREAKVCEEVFGNPNFLVSKSETIKAAINKYKSLQYDPLLEQYSLYNSKILELQTLITDTTLTMENAREVQELIVDMNVMLKKREEVVDMVVKKNNEDDDQIEGGGKLNFLEKRNKGNE